LAAPAVYYRAESPTQTPADAIRQEQSGELWGGAARFSDIPKVKAYVGPMPDGQRGVEFTTTVQPDSSCPPGQVYWSGPRVGVDVSHGCAKIKINVVRNTQVP
jgi:hypothetical protein